MSGPKSFEISKHLVYGAYLRVQRWLKAPLQRPDGTLVARDRGSPQGSAISPLLANLFMHYAFDAWMAREFPDVRFERYCDDVVIDCRSQDQACLVRDAVARRLAECGGLQLHPGKTRIVYCKDGKRRESYEHTSFTFGPAEPGRLPGHPPPGRAYRMAPHSPSREPPTGLTCPAAARPPRTRHQRAGPSRPPRPFSPVPADRAAQTIRPGRHRRPTATRPATLGAYPGLRSTHADGSICITGLRATGLRQDRGEADRRLPICHLQRPLMPR